MDQEEDLVLQPHKGASETRAVLEVLAGGRALQPHKGASETLPRMRS